MPSFVLPVLLLVNLKPEMPDWRQDIDTSRHSRNLVNTMSLV